MDASTSAPVRPAAGWVRFAPAALALFCIQLDFFALGLALPVIATDLDVTTTDLQWVISGYLLALGSLMIPASRLGDILGRKRVLLWGVAIFRLSLLLCGLASTPGVLIAARVLQGVGGALILPVAYSLIASGTSEAERARTLGVIVGAANVGTAIGPLVGGALASSVGWRWLQLVRGYSAVVAGLVFAVPAIGTSLCGPISGRLAGRFPAGQVIAVSIILGALGLLLQAAGDLLVIDLVGLSISGIAFGMGFNFTNIATQSVLPVELSAESSGLTLTTMVTLGGFGVVFGAIGLELFDAARHGGYAVTHVLIWTALVSIVVGVSFGWSQRHGARM